MAAGFYSSWDSDVILTNRDKMNHAKDLIQESIDKVKGAIAKDAEANRGKYATQFASVGETAQKEHTKIGNASVSLVDELTKLTGEIESLDSTAASRINIQ